MGGAGSSRRVRVQPAWRASASDEEARAFLQSRLVTVSGVMFAALCTLQLFFVVLYQSYPHLLPAWKRAVFYADSAVGLAFLALIWRLVLVRRVLTERALYRVDLLYALMIGATFGSAALLSWERRA